jgi:sulfide:quinone oxidoreductase
MPRETFNVVIAGGGVAGLEALLALHALAGDRVSLTLASPQHDFVYRPLAVAEPFALGRARHTPLADATREVGGRLITAGVQSVDPAQRTVRFTDGATERYDALVLAVGGQATPAVPHALTWDDRTEHEILGGLLQDIEQGYSRRLAVIIPPGPGWPLPGYELAMLIGEQARGMGATLETTLVTPEAEPLSIFGQRAALAVRAELEMAGVALETASTAEIERGHATTVVLSPSGKRIEVDRVLALPRVQGRAVAGIPADDEGFVKVDEHSRVVGVPGVWAAGDGIAFPVKFGGLASAQADAAAADIAAEAGAVVERTPFRPVLRGRLLTGRGERWLRHDAAGDAAEGEVARHALWWPPGKVSGRYLSPWLAARDEEAVAGQLPGSGGLAVQTDLNQHVGAG